MLRLWICLHLSSLPLEVFRPNWSTELAVAVLDKERVHLASRLAAEAGVRPQMRRGGVLTIAPQTLLYDRAPEKEADALQRMAMAFLQFAALVQITGASEKRRIRRYIIVLKGLPSKQQAQWYL
jgi:protein ImuB